MQIIIGIFGLGIIVCVHELGHFLAAKYYKLDVIEFALGMGPRLFSYKYGATIYSIRILPLGGFCQIKSEHEAVASHQNKTISQTPGTLFMLPTYKKAAVLLAGPCANILWYILMSLFLYIGGFSMIDIPAKVDPIQNTPAAKAQLQPGDTVTSINGKEISSFSQLASASLAAAGKIVEISYTQKDGSQRTTTAALGSKSPFLGVHPFIDPLVTFARAPSWWRWLFKKNNQQLFMQGDVIVRAGKKIITNAFYLEQELAKYSGYTVPILVERNGREVLLIISIPHKNIMHSLGISFGFVRVRQWNSFREFALSRLTQMTSIITSAAKTIFQLVIPAFRGGEQTDIAGPVRIISIMGGNTILSAQTQGTWYAVMQFINMSAVISLAIAVMNLLPIPVLDGGQLVFYLAYAIRKKLPSYKALALYQSIGTAILLLLFVFVIYKDITHFFTGGF